MKCPSCHSNSKVTDSRPMLNSIKRRRKCGKCGRIYYTLEILLDSTHGNSREGREQVKRLEAFMTDDGN